jgi:hypothetical protein
MHESGTYVLAKQAQLVVGQDERLPLGDKPARAP